jgi:hypothetical protein
MISAPAARGRDRHRHEIYGVVLDTPYEIIGLREVEKKDATVVLAAAAAGAFARASRDAGDRSRAGNDDDWFHHATQEDGSEYLRWSGHFEFLIDAAGSEIVFSELDAASPEALQTYLLGQVLSFALLKQGIEPLHATTVVVDGRAVAFAGGSGAGKSTLAASFLAAGHRLLTDDLLVLEEGEDEVLGYPGMPRLKLYPEVAATLLPAAAAGVAMNEFTRKRILPLMENQFRDSVAPLAAIFILESPPDSAANATGSRAGESTPRFALGSPEIEPLPSRRAFFDLIENTFNPLLDDRQRLRHQFHQIARWIERVPVATLRGPRDLGRVSELRDAVLDYLRPRPHLRSRP